MFEDVPRFAGSLHDRSAQTTFLSGVTSMNCTGSPPASLPCQLLMMVLPLARRTAVWVFQNRYSGASAGRNSHTVSPLGLTSRTKLLLLAMRVLPFLRRSADQGDCTLTLQPGLPCLSYSTTL